MSKRSLFVGLLGLALVGLALLRSFAPDMAPRTSHVPGMAREANAAEIPSASQVTTPPRHGGDRFGAADRGPGHGDGHGIPGEEIPVDPQGSSTLGGRGFTRADLPPCRFTRELDALSTHARAHALAQMAAAPFPRADLASRHLAPSGDMFYACPEPPPPSVQAWALGQQPQGAVAAPLPVSPFPAALTFHSRPGSPNTIYLDFTGGVVPKTRWGGPFDCHPFSDDADETTYNDTDQKLITGIWQRVAEDYAPFDVDVTTERPAVWNSRTAHAMITPSTDRNGVALPHSGSGGVAWVGVFGNPDFSYNSGTSCTSPAWVGEYGTGYGWYSAMAASHEIGHNLGLSHDGSPTNEYYGSHPIAPGSGISWGPIMGGGASPQFNQWSKGEYLGATNTEDDVGIIAGKLGYRPAETGGTEATAKPLGMNGNLIVQTGCIQTSGEIDVYRLATGQGSMTVTAAAAKLAAGDWGCNLDLQIELWDQTGKMLASANPADDCNATMNFSVPAVGTYYLHVRGAGLGDPMTSPVYGYTAYGSLGTYTLGGTIAALIPQIQVQGSGAAIAAGDTTPDTADGTDLGVVGAGDPLVATFRVGNIGGVPLHLSGSPPVVLVGDPAFTLAKQPDATIAPNVVTTTFQVAFRPTSPGVRTTVVSIASDAPDLPMWTCTLQGTGRSPTLEVSGNGLAIPPGDVTPDPRDLTDAGPVAVGSALTRNFTLTNRGLGTLTVTGPVTLAGSGDFTLSAAPATTLASGSSTTLGITFTPRDSGLASAVVSVPSSDGATPAYSFTVQGVGTRPGVTFLAWHVNHGLERGDARSVITTARPDVILLIDESDGTAILRGELKAAMGMDFTEYSPSQANSGLPVKFLSRLPMTAQVDLGSAALDVGAKIQNSVPKIDVTVDGEVFHLAGMMAAGASNAATQKAEIDAILANLKAETGHARTVLLGNLGNRAASDGAVHAPSGATSGVEGWGYFNTASTTAVLAAGYRDSWRVVNPTRAVQPTRAWNQAQAKGGFQQYQRVDYAFVSPDLTILDAGIITEAVNDPSPYKPVWVRLGTAAGTAVTQGGARRDRTPEIIGSTASKDGTQMDVVFSEGVFADAAATLPLTTDHFEVVVESYGASVGTGAVTGVAHVPGSATATLTLAYTGALTTQRGFYVTLAGALPQGQNKPPRHIFNRAGVADTWSRMLNGFPVAGSIRTNTHRINVPPVIANANPVAVTMSEDGAPTAFKLTLNGSDVDGDTLAWSIAKPPVNGVASVPATGSAVAVAYLPAGNWFGTDSFTVQVADGQGGLVQVTVNVTVQSVNDPPVGLPLAVTTLKNTPATFALSASDVDGTLGSYAWTTPAHGKLTGTGNLLTYTPSTGYEGPDSFTWTVKDNLGAASAPATVTLGVLADLTHVPTFTSGDAVTVPENGTGVTTLAAKSPAGDPITYQIAGGPDGARFAIDASTGALTFIAAPDYELPVDAGRDNVYQVSVLASSGVGVVSQLVTIAVADVPDQAPVIQRNPVSIRVLAGSLASFSVEASGLAPMSYAWLRNGTVIPGASSADYTCTALPLDDEAVFQCRVVNSLGQATSASAVLGVDGMIPGTATLGTDASGGGGGGGCGLGTGVVLVGLLSAGLARALRKSRSR